MRTDHEIAQSVARFYTKRVRHAEYDDCYQEAVLALLTARRTFNPEKGEWEPYAMRASTRQVRQALYRSGSPVTGRCGHAQQQLAGHVRVEVSTALLDVLEVSNRLNTPPDTLLEEAQRRMRLGALLDDIGGRMRPQSALAVKAVLLLDLTPTEAAEKYATDPETVSMAVRRVRGLLKERHSEYLAAVL